jgi:hypothetical protein
MPKPFIHELRTDSHSGGAYTSRGYYQSHEDAHADAKRYGYRPGQYEIITEKKEHQLSHWKEK